MKKIFSELESDSIDKIRISKDAWMKKYMGFLLSLNLGPNVYTGLSFVAAILLALNLSGNVAFSLIFIFLVLFFDGVDGFVAREKKMASEFGAKLDLFTDNFGFLFVLIGVIYHRIVGFEIGLWYTINYFFSVLLLNFVGKNKNIDFVVLKTKTGYFFLLALVLVSSFPLMNSAYIWFGTYLFLSNLIIIKRWLKA